jgi:hypothetical protein
MSPNSYESGIGRRDFFCSGGSAIFSSLIAALLGGAKPARAQTISGNVPEVDRATVRVVTDNYHFALSPSGKIGDVSRNEPQGPALATLPACMERPSQSELPPWQRAKWHP